MENIEIRGARTHNLKNISIDIPRNKLVVITGLSGSGKSSLAFDTLYAEGQRRYVESLSPYARQFLSLMEKPDVDHIEGLSPAISIEQKTSSHNPRSTVGTITEIYDYLRLLFARTGEARCPHHGISLNAQTVSQMVDQVMTVPEGTKLMILSPVVSDRKGEYKQLLSALAGEGFVRARIDGEICDLSDPPELKLKKKHTIEVIVDRFKVRADAKQRIAESFETALKKSGGLAYVDYMEPQEGQKMMTFSDRFACPVCGYSLNELEPRLFSFNNPVGACRQCGGLGVCEQVDRSRLIPDPALSVAGGAIRGWGESNFYYFQILKSVAEHYHFSLDVPFRDLTPYQQSLLLDGTGDTAISITIFSENGQVRTVKKPFEGVIGSLVRRHENGRSWSFVDLSVYFKSMTCPSCGGSRLNERARNVFVKGYGIKDIISMPIAEAQDFFLKLSFDDRRQKIAEKVLKEIRDRLLFLVKVGLGYLTLARTAETLSGGEAQRIRLASQIGAGLVGVMYVLDEPSIGLHQRDNGRLIETMRNLRDLGNTVIVVEHDEETMKASDYIIDVGPGAGVHGGTIVASGTPQEIMDNPASVTGDYLAGRKVIEIPARKPPIPDRWLKITGASGNNLKQADLEIPLGLFTCITGVSGSGKSTLINETLYPIAARKLNGAGSAEPMKYDSCSGFEFLDKVIAIDQDPIGRTPRSNPATYVGAFTPIRDLFEATPEARARGYSASRFSFNVRGGRCEACSGDGLIKVEMNFLPDVYVPCDVCGGARYNRETLDIKYKGKNISEVLNMSVEEAYEFFKAIPTVEPKLKMLCEVGLSYITIGQSATMLSGGEAQRIKLAKELARRDTSRTLYILDEPTTGLHFKDVDMLLKVLFKLRDRGNTIVVIEHNMDVIKTADWIVDLGPEGGDGGGKIIACGTPEKIALSKRSHTGRFLKPVLEAGGR